MSETDQKPDAKSPEDVRSWLLARVSHYVDQPVEAIDPESSLAHYGLDSIYAFALCGDIEDTLGVPIEPTLIWDVDTLNALHEHLMVLIGGPAEDPLP
jgi:acyl carrier protein